MKHPFVCAILLPACGALLLAVDRSSAEFSVNVLKRERHHRIVQTASGGAYTEIADGLCYQNERGHWVDSEELFEIIGTTAVARRGQHKVTLAANINSERVVELIAPDGKRFVSRFAGLSYFDAASGQNILLARVQDSIGMVHLPNQVIYPAALAGDGFTADVRYTWRKGSFEQDVILRETPPSPEVFQMNPATTRLQAWTMFVEAPEPEVYARILRREADAAARQIMVEPDFADQELKFGALAISLGQAFSLGQDKDVQSIPVGKEWGTTEAGETFLIESLEYSAAKPRLDELSERKTANVTKEGVSNLAARRMSRSQLMAALARPVVSQWAGESQMQVAQVNSPTRPGFVIDYITLYSGYPYSYNNHVFQSGQTYYLSGPVTLTGTAVLEGGSVLKLNGGSYGSTGGLRVDSGSTIKSIAAAWNPCIITAMDDNTVGEVIAGSTGTPSGNYGGSAIYIQYATASAPVSLAHIRVRYATIGMNLQYCSGLHEIRHSQFINCGKAFQLYYTTLQPRNVLVANNAGYTSGSVVSGDGNSTLRAENMTVHSAGYLRAYMTSASVYLTNTLLVGVGSAAYTGGINNETVASDAGVFQTPSIGAGARYLANNTYRNLGTDQINPALLSELRQRTTFSPLVLSSDFTTPQTLAARSLGDVDQIDLGYHYEILDYAWSGRNLTSTLLLTNGVAVAHFGTRGTTLGAGAMLISEGSPASRNHLVPYNMVQENPAAWGTSGSTFAIMGTSGSQVSPAPQVYLRFTDVSFPASLPPKRQLVEHANGNLLQSLVLRDCEMSAAYLIVSNSVSGATGLTAAFTNNLFRRVLFTLRRDANTPLVTHLYNNLFINSTLGLLRNLNTGTAWEVHDNLFDTVSLTAGSAALANSHNGYLATTVLPGASATQTVTTRNYQSGLFGTNYYPTAPPTGSLEDLIEAGSRSAVSAGLYHYTTTGPKETGQVDIGYHFVAATGTQPTDTDSDGRPDYLEDSNGNGETDPTEKSWAGPIISFSPGPMNYAVGLSAQIIDANATASDVDSDEGMVSLNGGRLAVALSRNGQSADVLSIRHQGMGSGQIGLSGTSVTFGGVSMGTWEGGSSATPLMVHFNSYAQIHMVQTLMRSLQFHNTTVQPVQSTRQIRAVLTDGYTGTSAAATKDIVVSCPNGIDLMLLIDVSYSLSPTDFPKAKNAAANFLSRLDYAVDRIGVATIHGDPNVGEGSTTLISALTHDPTDLAQTIRDLGNVGGTRLAPAIELAQEQFGIGPQGNARIIVMMTDGIVQTETDRIADTNAAYAAKLSGTRIIVVGIKPDPANGVFAAEHLSKIVSSLSDLYPPNQLPIEQQLEAAFVSVAQTICRGNRPPIVDANAHPNNVLPLITPGQPFTLDASVTDDGLPLGGTLTELWSVVSAPPSSTVAFNPAARADTQITLSHPGSYTLRLSASDGELTGSADLIVPVFPNSTDNQGPFVEAGRSQQLFLNGGASVGTTLAGTAYDDGRPSGSLTVAWSTVSPTSGPQPIISSPNSASTSVSFSAPGKYVLRLAVSDGALQSSDTVEVIVCQAEVPLDVVLVLDGSGSFAGEPFRRAKDAALAFADAVNSPIHQLALMGFATQSRLAFPLTNDIEFAKMMIESFNRTDLGPLYTLVDEAMPAAVREVLSSRHRSFAEPVIVLFSDGVFDEVQASAAHYAKAAGVRLVTVRGTTVDPMPTEQRIELMERFATNVEDSYDGTDFLNMEEVFRSVALSMCLQRNRRPSVDLGGNFGIASGTQVTISSDVFDHETPQGPFTYTWSVREKPDGSAYQIGNPNVASLTTTFNDPGVYVLRLTVGDGQLQAYDDIAVTNNGIASVAAGQVRCVPLSQPTLPLADVLLPSSTTEPFLQVMWKQVSGPGTVRFENPNSPSMETPHSLFAQARFPNIGTYELRLIADDSLNSVVGALTVHVYNDSIAAHVPDAGQHQTVSRPSAAPVQTRLSAEVARPCDAYSYAWSQLEGPQAASIDNAALPSPMVTFSAAGLYKFKVQVTHGASQMSGSDEVIVHVVSGVVDAGTDKNVRFCEADELVGTALDNLGNPLAVTWAQVSGPPGGSTIVDPAASRTPVLFKAPGSYEFQLVAGAAVDKVSIAVNEAPVVSASLYTQGNNALEAAGVFDRVFLKGTVADDFLPPGRVLLYQWSKQSGPGDVRFANPQAAFTSAAFTEGGSYVLKLRVTDSHLVGESLVTVQISRPPVARIDFFYDVVGKPSYLLDVLANDFDPDGGELTVVSARTWGESTTYPVVGSKQIRWAPATVGAGMYRLVYEVSNAAGRKAVADIFIFLREPNQDPKAQHDQYLRSPGSDEEAVNVLANDLNVNDYPEASEGLAAPLTIVAHSVPVLGTARIKYSTSANGVQTAELLYTPPTSAGTATHETFTYTVSDAFGATSTATVFIYFTQEPPKQVVIEGPATATAKETYTYVATITGSYAYVVWSWSVAGSPPGAGVEFGGGPVTEVRFLAPGIYTLRAQLPTTEEDYFEVEVLPHSLPPIAEMFNVPNDEKGLEPIPVIREGILELRGIADDPDVPDQASVEYQIMLYKPATGFDLERALLANLTPASNPPLQDGFRRLRVSGEANEDELGELDLTEFENGIYELELTVRIQGTAQETVITRTFALNSELKIGNLSFTETDYSVPGGSLPVTLMRTYNSMDTTDVGFGPGWTYSIVTMDVELNETREILEDEEGEPFEARAGGGRDITLTLPDGRRVTFVFGFRQGSDYLYAEWYAPPGVHATLEPLQDNRINLLLPGLSNGRYDFYWEAGGPDTSIDAFEFSAFRLTMEDGTQFMLERSPLSSLGHTLIDGSFVRPYGPLRLTRVMRPNGEKIEIGKEALRQGTSISEIRIDHYDSSNARTRSLVVEKSATGKITGIRDPQGFDAAGQPTGPLVVAYDYYSAGDTMGDAGILAPTDPRIGNLKAVRRLTNRTANGGQGAYDATTYIYGRADYPRHITDIRDARNTVRAVSVYDNAGKLIEIVNGGHRTLITHDVNAKQEIITEKIGQEPNAVTLKTTTHSYDSRGNVTWTAITDGITGIQQTTSRQFYDDGKLQNETVSGIGYAYEYDFAGNVAKTTVPEPDPVSLRQTIDRTFNHLGQALTEIDVRSHTTSHEYDALGNLLLSRDALGNATQYTYENDRLKTQSDALGNKTVYTYYDGSPSTLADGRRGDLKSIDIQQQIAPNSFLTLSTTSYKYDINGNRRFEITMRTLPNNQLQTLTTEYEYDAQGRVVKTKNPLLQVTETIYNNIGKVDRTIDKFGKVTQYFYDARGNLVQTENPGDTGTFTAMPATISRTVYDANNRPIYVQDRHEKPVSGNSSAAPGTYTEYDGMGRVKRTKRLSSLTITLVTDGAGISTTTVAGEVDSDPLIQTQITEYDGLGRVQYKLDPEGHGTRSTYSGTRLWKTQDSAGETTYTYDGNGNQRTVTRFGVVAAFAYDALNRRIATTNYAESNPNAGIASFEEYDVLGRKAADIDAEGVVTRFGYDALGRLTAVTNRYLPPPAANPFVTRYTYDQLGNLRTQTDANGRVTTFEYDQLGRRTKRILPGTPVIDEVYTYDKNAANQLANEQTVEDFNGRVTRLVFDALGRLRRKIPDATGFPGAAPVAFTYYPAGERKQMTDASGTTDYQYDITRRLSQKKWTDVADGTRSFTVNYTSDRRGNVISAASVHGGTSLGYEWDGAMRLARVTNYVANPDIVSEYTHTGLDRQLQYKRSDPNSPVTTYLHDGFGRLQQVETLRNGAQRARFTYTLGDSGVRKTLAEVGLAIPTPGTRTINYAYDGLYRSTAETISGADSGLNGSVGYTHDNVGNRLARSLAAAESELAAKVPAGSSTYTSQDRLEPAANFDNNGNTLLGDVLPAQTAADVYNFDNRLIQRSTTIGGQAATVALVYDGDGNRVKKLVTIGGNTTTTYFVVDDRSPTGYPQVLEELTRNGAAWVVQRAYTYGERLLIQHRPVASEWRFVCQDGHGSTRFLTDLGGNITDKYTYDAFGNLLWFSGSTPNNFLYAGEQFDADLGLYYLRDRYYNPFTGRFWTTDRHEGHITAPLSLHKYLYCNADPVNRIDPSGQMSFGELGAVMTKIGTLAARTYGAVNNMRWMAYARLTPVVEKGLQAFFWADVAATTIGAAAVITPELLNSAANLADRINRAYSMNTAQIPQGWGTRGFAIENIGGQQLETMGGTYVGGNVKGIDGTIGIAEGNVLVSFKSHDLADDKLVEQIGKHMRQLSQLDPEEIRGTTAGRTRYALPPGPVPGRIAVFGVPESQVRYIISPQFIEQIRAFAEETKTIPIIRAVRNFRSSR